jgi:DNA-binding NarL/FixJ family response regulator
VRVLVVDDSPAFRRAARLLLERRGYEIVGEAATAGGAIVLAAELRPAAALIDVRLEESSGYELAAELRRRSPRLAVLLTSTEGDGMEHARAEVAGARGFVLKSELARCDLTQFWPPRGPGSAGRSPSPNEV